LGNLIFLDFLGGGIYRWMGMGMKFNFFFEFVWTCNNKKRLVFKFKCLNLNLNKTRGQIRAQRLAIPTVRYRLGQLRDYSSAGCVGLHVTITGVALEPA
jgi:hypothetical protein